MFDYDDTVNLAFDAKIAGKKLVTAKHELLTKTGDFLFLAHSDKELAQRMQMVEEDIEKVAYRKLANVSDSKAKLVRAVYEEWSIRHANCDFCKESSTKTAWGWNPISDLGQAISDVGSGAGKAVKGLGNAAKGVAHAVGTGVGDTVSGVGSAAKAVGNEVTKLPGQATNVAKGVANAVGTGAKDVAHAVGTGVGDATRAVGKGVSAVGNEVQKLPSQVSDVAKGVAHAVGTGVGAAASGIGSAAQAAGNAVGTAAADVAHSTANQFDRARHDVAGAADAVGTAATDVAKGVAAPFAGAAAAAGSLISQFTKGVQGDKPSGASTPPAPSVAPTRKAPSAPSSVPATNNNMHFQTAPGSSAKITDPDTDNDPNDPNEGNPNVKDGAARKIARLSYFLKESKDTNFTV